MSVRIENIFAFSSRPGSRPCIQVSFVAFMCQVVFAEKVHAKLCGAFPNNMRKLTIPSVLGGGWGVLTRQT